MIAVALYWSPICPWMPVESPAGTCRHRKLFPWVGWGSRFPRGMACTLNLPWSWLQCNDVGYLYSRKPQSDDVSWGPMRFHATPHVNSRETRQEFSREFPRDPTVFHEVRCLPVGSYVNYWDNPRYTVRCLPVGSRSTSHGFSLESHGFRWVPKVAHGYFPSSPGELHPAKVSMLGTIIT